MILDEEATPGNETVADSRVISEERARGVVLYDRTHSWARGRQMFSFTSSYPEATPSQT
jgi:hypothetical protein